MSLLLLVRSILLVPSKLFGVVLADVLLQTHSVRAYRSEEEKRRQHRSREREKDDSGGMSVESIRHDTSKPMMALAACFLACALLGCHQRIIVLLLCCVVAQRRTTRRMYGACS